MKNFLLILLLPLLSQGLLGDEIVEKPICNRQIQRKYCQAWFGGDLHTGCKYCGIGPQCPQGMEPSGRGIKNRPDLMEEILRRHNEYRAEVRAGKTGLPASKCIPELRWDEELAEVAQIWADQCANVVYFHQSDAYPRIFHERGYERTTSKFNSPPGVGQNVAWALTKHVNFTRIIDDLWYRDINKLQPGRIGDFQVDPTKMDTNLVTQILWGRTTHVGCGWTQFPLSEGSSKFDGIYAEGEYENFFVCNYGVGGNVPGEPVYEMECIESQDDDNTEENMEKMLAQMEIKFKDRLNPSTRPLQRSEIAVCLDALTCLSQRSSAEKSCSQLEIQCVVQIPPRIPNTESYFSSDSVIDRVSQLECKVETLLCLLPLEAEITSVSDKELCNANFQRCLEESSSYAYADDYDDEEDVVFTATSRPVVITSTFAPQLSTLGFSSTAAAMTGSTHFDIDEITTMIPKIGLEVTTLNPFSNLDDGSSTSQDNFVSFDPSTTATSVEQIGPKTGPSSSKLEDDNSLSPKPSSFESPSSTTTTTSLTTGTDDEDKITTTAATAEISKMGLEDVTTASDTMLLKVTVEEETAEKNPSNLDTESSTTQGTTVSEASLNVDSNSQIGRSTSTMSSSIPDDDLLTSSTTVEPSDNDSGIDDLNSPMVAGNIQQFTRTDQSTIRSLTKPKNDLEDFSSGASPSSSIKVDVTTQGPPLEMSSSSKIDLTSPESIALELATGDATSPSTTPSSTESPLRKTTRLDDQNDIFDITTTMNPNILDFLATGLDTTTLESNLLTSEGPISITMLIEALKKNSSDIQILDESSFNVSFYNSTSKTSLRLAICLEGIGCEDNARCRLVHQKCNEGMDVSMLPHKVRQKLSECSVDDILCHLNGNANVFECQRTFERCIKIVVPTSFIPMVFSSTLPPPSEDELPATLDPMSVLGGLATMANNKANDNILNELTSSVLSAIQNSTAGLTIQPIEGNVTIADLLAQNSTIPIFQDFIILLDDLSPSMENATIIFNPTSFFIGDNTTKLLDPSLNATIRNNIISAIEKFATICHSCSEAENDTQATVILPVQPSNNDPQLLLAVCLKGVECRDALTCAKAQKLCIGEENFETFKPNERKVVSECFVGHNLCLLNNTNVRLCEEEFELCFIEKMADFAQSGSQSGSVLGVDEIISQVAEDIANIITDDESVTSVTISGINEPLTEDGTVSINLNSTKGPIILTSTTPIIKFEDGNGGVTVNVDQLEGNGPEEKKLVAKSRIEAALRQIVVNPSPPTIQANNPDEETLAEMIANTVMNFIEDTDDKEPPNSIRLNVTTVEDLDVSEISIRGENQDELEVGVKLPGEVEDSLVFTVPLNPDMDQLQLSHEISNEFDKAVMKDGEDLPEQSEKPEEEPSLASLIANVVADLVGDDKASVPDEVQVEVISGPSVQEPEITLERSDPESNQIEAKVSIPSQNEGTLNFKVDMPVSGTNEIDREQLAADISSKFDEALAQSEASSSTEDPSNNKNQGNETSFALFGISQLPTQLQNDSANKNVLSSSNQQLEPTIVKEDPIDDGNISSGISSDLESEKANQGKNNEEIGLAAKVASAVTDFIAENDLPKVPPKVEISITSSEKDEPEISIESFDDQLKVNVEVSGSRKKPTAFEVSLSTLDEGKVDQEQIQKDVEAIFKQKQRKDDIETLGQVAEAIAEFVDKNADLEPQRISVQISKGQNVPEPEISIEATEKGNVKAVVNTFGFNNKKEETKFSVPLSNTGDKDSDIDQLKTSLIEEFGVTETIKDVAIAVGQFVHDNKDFKADKVTVKIQKGEPLDEPEIAIEPSEKGTTVKTIIKALGERKESTSITADISKDDNNEVDVDALKIALTEEFAISETLKDVPEAVSNFVIKNPGAKPEKVQVTIEKGDIHDEPELSLKTDDLRRVKVTIKAHGNKNVTTTISVPLSSENESHDLEEHIEEELALVNAIKDIPKAVDEFFNIHESVDTDKVTITIKKGEDVEEAEISIEETEEKTVLATVKTPAGQKEEITLTVPVPKMNGDNVDVDEFEASLLEEFAISETLRDVPKAVSNFANQNPDLKPDKVKVSIKKGEEYEEPELSLELTEVGKVNAIVTAPGKSKETTSVTLTIPSTGDKQADKEDLEKNLLEELGIIDAIKKVPAAIVNHLEGDDNKSQADKVTVTIKRGEDVAIPEVSIESTDRQTVKAIIKAPGKEKDETVLRVSIPKNQSNDVNVKVLKSALIEEFAIAETIKEVPEAVLKLVDSNPGLKPKEVQVVIKKNQESEEPLLSIEASDHGKVKATITVHGDKKESVVVSSPIKSTDDKKADAGEIVNELKNQIAIIDKVKEVPNAVAEFFDQNKDGKDSKVTVKIQKGENVEEPELSIEGSAQGGVKAVIKAGGLEKQETKVTVNIPKTQSNKVDKDSLEAALEEAFAIANTIKDVPEAVYDFVSENPNISLDQVQVAIKKAEQFDEPQLSIEATEQGKVKATITTHGVKNESTVVSFSVKPTGVKQADVQEIEKKLVEELAIIDTIKEVSAAVTKPKEGEDQTLLDKVTVTIKKGENIETPEFSIEPIDEHHLEATIKVAGDEKVETTIKVNVPRTDGNEVDSEKLTATIAEEFAIADTLGEVPDVISELIDPTSNVKPSKVEVTIIRGQEYEEPQLSIDGSDQEKIKVTITAHGEKKGSTRVSTPLMPSSGDKKADSEEIKIHLIEEFAILDAIEDIPDAVVKYLDETKKEAPEKITVVIQKGNVTGEPQITISSDDRQITATIQASAAKIDSTTLTVPLPTDGQNQFDTTKLKEVLIEDFALTEELKNASEGIVTFLDENKSENPSEVSVSIIKGHDITEPEISIEASDDTIKATIKTPGDSKDSTTLRVPLPNSGDKENVVVQLQNDLIEDFGVIETIKEDLKVVDIVSNAIVKFVEDGNGQIPEMITIDIQKSQDATEPEITVKEVEPGNTEAIVKVKGQPKDSQKVVVSVPTTSNFNQESLSEKIVDELKTNAKLPEKSESDLSEKISIAVIESASNEKLPSKVTVVVSPGHTIDEPELATFTVDSGEEVVVTVKLPGAPEEPITFETTIPQSSEGVIDRKKLIEEVSTGLKLKKDPEVQRKPDDLAEMIAGKVKDHVKENPTQQTPSKVTVNIQTGKATEEPEIGISEADENVVTVNVNIQGNEEDSKTFQVPLFKAPRSGDIDAEQLANDIREALSEIITGLFDSATGRPDDFVMSIGKFGITIGTLASGETGPITEVSSTANPEGSDEISDNQSEVMSIPEFGFTISAPIANESEDNAALRPVPSTSETSTTLSDPKDSDARLSTTQKALGDPETEDEPISEAVVPRPVESSDTLPAGETGQIRPSTTLRSLEISSTETRASEQLSPDSPPAVMLPSIESGSNSKDEVNKIGPSEANPGSQKEQSASSEETRVEPTPTSEVSSAEKTNQVSAKPTIGESDVTTQKSTEPTFSKLGFETELDETDGEMSSTEEPEITQSSMEPTSSKPGFENELDEKDSEISSTDKPEITQSSVEPTSPKPGFETEVSESDSEISSTAKPEITQSSVEPTFSKPGFETIVDEKNNEILSSEKETTINEETTSNVISSLSSSTTSEPTKSEIAPLVGTKTVNNDGVQVTLTTAETTTSPTTTTTETSSFFSSGVLNRVRDLVIALVAGLVAQQAGFTFPFSSSASRNDEEEGKIIIPAEPRLPPFVAQDPFFRNKVKESEGAFNGNFYDLTIPVHPEEVDELNNEDARKNISNIVAEAFGPDKPLENITVVFGQQPDNPNGQILIKARPVALPSQVQERPKLPRLDDDINSKQPQDPSQRPSTSEQRPDPQLKQDDQRRPDFDQEARKDPSFDQGGPVLRPGSTTRPQLNRDQPEIEPRESSAEPPKRGGPILRPRPASTTTITPELATVTRGNFNSAKPAVTRSPVSRTSEGSVKFELDDAVKRPSSTETPLRIPVYGQYDNTIFVPRLPPQYQDYGDEPEGILDSVPVDDNRIYDRRLNVLGGSSANVVEATVVEDLNYARSVRDSRASKIGIATISSITVGVIALLAFGLLIFMAMARRRRRKDEANSSSANLTPTQSRTTYSGTPIIADTPSVSGGFGDDPLNTTGSSSIDPVIPLDGHQTIISSYNEFMALPGRNTIVNSLPSPPESSLGQGSGVPRTKDLREYPPLLFAPNNMHYHHS